jgi:hypothetical protein
MSAGATTDTGSMYTLHSEFCMWPVSHFILCLVTHVWCVCRMLSNLLSEEILHVICCYPMYPECR